MDVGKSIRIGSVYFTYLLPGLGHTKACAGVHNSQSSPNPDTSSMEQLE
jgi:hypothetical protein